MIYYVAKDGKDFHDGSMKNPLLTINAAAQKAVAGDTVIVREGTYREWVKPTNSGLSEKRRIVFKAEEGHKVIIKGSEQINTWEKVEGNVWKAEIDNEFFGNYNPYIKTVSGDWLLYKADIAHLGDVYINGNSLYEVETYDELLAPEIKDEILDNYTGEIVNVVGDPELTTYVWYVETDFFKTTIYANFHNLNPNKELTEINVRRSCFYPEKIGINYITVSGFEMCHAATPWTPPTSDQPGLIGPNWSKGWIIENNIIHDSKCSAISIGKEASTGEGYSTTRGDKPGFSYQLESVFAGLKIGWSKEKIGSHIIRNNEIYDCGQNAIVGHMGSAFCEIYGNHIYNIGSKREYYGHEIAGIKLHAAIDTQIYDNCIHDCSMGLWLDWQADGSRVSRNLFYNNCRDIWIEVTHGPQLVDNNIFESKYSVDNHAQGSAFVNNLLAGKIVLRPVLDRMTPYHAPHSTDILGYIAVFGGDDHIYSNLFIGGFTDEMVGTEHYEKFTTSVEEYKTEVKAKDRNDFFVGDHELFQSTPLPVYVENNYYLNGAKASSKETKNYMHEDFNPRFKIVEEGGDVFMYITLPDSFSNEKAEIVTTENFSRLMIKDVEFEDVDGTDIEIDRDYFNSIRKESTLAGPINSLKPGENKIKVWPK